MVVRGGLDQPLAALALGFVALRAPQKTAHWAVFPSQGSSLCKLLDNEKGPVAGTLLFMVVRGGLEPSARGFSVRCSTN